MTDILNLYLPYFGRPCLNIHNRHYSTSGLPMLSSEKYFLFCKILLLWMKIAFYIYNDVGCENDQKSTFSLHWWLWRFWWWRSICRQTYPNHTKKILLKVCIIICNKWLVHFMFSRKKCVFKNFQFNIFSDWSKDCYVEVFNLRLDQSHKFRESY